MMLESTDLSQWTLDRVFRARAAATPDAPFVEDSQSGAALTFGAAYACARELAAGLAAHGVAPGDRVCLMASNSLQSLNCWFALNLAGAVDVSINPANRGQVLEYLVNKADASVLIAEQDLLGVLRDSEDALPRLREILFFARDGEPVAALPSFRRIAVAPLAAVRSEGSPRWTPASVSGGDVASVLFTSGTSGPSKGVMVTHAHALLSALSCVQGVRMTSADSLYCFHPFFHMAAKHCGILPALLAGARVVIDRRFDPQRWVDTIRRHGATVSLGHGPMLEMIFQQPARSEDRDTALTRIVCAPMPKHIGVEFEKRFGVRAIEIWGMTEIGLPCWRPFDEPLRPGSCGKVLHEWFDVRVADPLTGQELPRGTVGELRVRPARRETVMAGYLDDPAATAASWDGEWFRSADSGFMDETGWVYMLDRITDRIRRRGENISPADIEAAAAQHPAVLECVAVGVASGYVADDDIKLCLVLKPGHQLIEEEFISFMAKKLPHFMVPRYIELLHELPRTPTNKVRRSELRKQGVASNTWDRKAAGVDLRQVITDANARR